MVQADMTIEQCATVTDEQNNTPVLMLDFDGCLHELGEPAIDENFCVLDNPRLFRWMPILRQLLEPYPEVRLIISSDWRRILDDETLIRLLGSLGKRFYGVVETYGPSWHDEILTEVQRRGLNRWIALDDHPSIAIKSRRNWRFISYSPDSGLSDQRVQQELKRKLNRLTKSKERS